MPHRVIDPFFRRLIILAFVGGLLYALFLLRSVITPFVVAFIFAYMLNPLVSKLAQKMPRILAIVIVYVLSLIVCVALLVWLLPMLWQQLQMFWQSIPVAVVWYNDVAKVYIEKNTDFNLPTLDFDTLSVLMTYIQSNYEVSDAQSMIRKILSSGINVASTFGLFVMMPILTFYFLIDWQTRLHTWLSAFPLAYQKKVVSIAKDCDVALMSFIKGQLSVMLLLGMIYAVQLQLIGLNLGLIIGISAGIASFVPYLGFAVGILSALIAGVMQFGFSPVHLVLIIGAFMVGQAMEGYVLQPLLLGDKIGLSALWVIFSVLAGASLFGFVGMLIALPVSAIINVLFHHTYEAYRQSNYYFKGQVR
ncbi:AI-2E family transporter [Moraxella sp. VT-16-12]|uniref:AI-2E family transporter n=1 Tax=Moraxella sp. VT-16-12 TaxID=2014877 RepID=UPI000B7D3A3C|nr:AI-2E family transporter [Moraxella sp. VT-16-12]TWV80243.1 AI-2E family transporter [Moraxella sp. VT-16-12]